MGRTDLLMLSFILMAIYFYLNGNNFITILICIFSFLIKPQSIFILFIISFIFINRINYKKYLFFYLYFLFYILIFILTLLINNLGDNVIILSTFAKYTNWIFLESLFEGVIIHDRIFTEYENTLSIFKIYFLRFINFYSIYFNEFSIKHKLYKIIYFVIIYLPIVLFIFKQRLFDKKFIEFSIGCIIIISLFFILTVIDYDLRYRLYLYPFLIMLSSYCFKKFMIQSNKDFLGQNYIFIFGFPGSGTTIFSEQLSRNLNSALWLEPYFIWRKKLKNKYFDNFQSKDFNEKIIKQIRADFYYFYKKSNKKILIEKEPRNILNFLIIKKIFPYSKFIFIKKY